MKHKQHNLNEQVTSRIDPLKKDVDSDEHTAIVGAKTVFDDKPGEIPVSASGAEKRPVLITLDGRRVSERFVISAANNILGRDVGAAVKVADGEVSRKHALLIWKNYDKVYKELPKCSIRDLGSTNGTFVNNNKLEDAERDLKDGDLIRIGRTVLGFFLKDERVLELDQLLLSMALHDSLTRLYKREFFFSELHREFDRAKRYERPLAFAILDIDHFKRINDEYGHLRGDEILRQFADMLRLSLREGDICGRYGGEEFAVVLPETEIQGAMQALERFRERVESTGFSVGGETKIHITCSCGVAALRNHHDDKMALIDEADKALYRAKNIGRNCTIKAEFEMPEEGTRKKKDPSSEG